jgi:hypothetical protein
MSRTWLRSVIGTALAAALAILPAPLGGPARVADAADDGVCEAPAVVEVLRPAPDPDVDTAGWSEDDGNGSFQLCLDGERSTTGAATCTWSGDRSAVLSAHADRVPIGRYQVDMDLTAAVSLGADTPTDIQLWVERPIDDAVEVTFRASRWGYPEAAGLAGTLAVRCGEPPPLGADRTVGRLTFQVGHDGPVYHAGVVCEWVEQDLQATVGHVDALQDRVRMGDDQFAATDIDMTSGQGRSMAASLYVGARFDFTGAEYHDDRTAFPLWASEDRHAGLLPVLRMVPANGTPMRRCSLTRPGWTCS